jgi:hypothetical protein
VWGGGDETGRSTADIIGTTAINLGSRQRFEARAQTLKFAADRQVTKFEGDT